jgi:hypothetical protein
MEAIEVWFWRWDREPKVHYYGTPVDRALDELAGGANRLDRTVTLPGYPTATIGDTGVAFELHEDGVQLQLLVEHVPAFLEAIGTLLLAWVAFRPRGVGRTERSVKIRVGEHSYEGNPNRDELEPILDMFKGFATAKPKRGKGKKRK